MEDEERQFLMTFFEPLNVVMTEVINTFITCQW